MRKPTKPELKAKLSIFNPHDFCRVGGGRVWICYLAQTTGRGSMPARWQVAGVGGIRTDPSGPWYNYGAKTFVCNSASRNAQLDAAKKWAGEKYGITEWVRDPFGDWQDAKVYAEVIRRMAA
jgi:hypothetical protein